MKRWGCFFTHKFSRLIGRRFFFLFVILVCSQATFAQTQITLHLNFITEKADKELEKTAYKSTFLDTTEAIQEIKNVLNVFWVKGFINVVATDFLFEENTLGATIRTGKSYNIFHLKKIVYDDTAMVDRNFSITQKKYSATELARLKEKIVLCYEQQAYPFVSVVLDSIDVLDNAIAANLKITAHKKVIIDSILIAGNTNINKKYLYKYIGIKPNDGYDERVIKAITNRLRELPFLSETKPYNVIFTKKYTKLVLQLNKRKANRFDGFLGFLPNEKTGKINFTGQLTIKLLNTIAHGETMEIEWRKLQSLTQDLKTNIIYPYIFNLPFGLEHNLKLYKRDTTFIDVANALGVQYLLMGGNYLKFFVSKRNINLINTAGYESASSLPEFADISNTSYGLSINLNNTDYKLNPRKGLKTIIQATVGTKQIRKNQAFNQSVYDSLQLSSQQYQVQSVTSYFIPLFKKSTLLLDIKYATIIGKNIFTNELYRIGGLVSLRGFDEESINASTYVMPSIEYRYLFDRNSAIFLFANGAYYENISRTKREFDRPFGFGTGIFFETKAGIFSLTYALGKQFNNPILIKNAKIHFGLVSVF